MSRTSKWHHRPYPSMLNLRGRRRSVLSMRAEVARDRAEAQWRQYLAATKAAA